MIFERRSLRISMEAVRFHGSIDQPISPYKSHIRNLKNNNQFSVYENFMPSNFQNMGLLQAPPPPPPPPILSHSYPPYSIHKPQQPPLLPLPTANPRHGSAMLGRGMSCSTISRKTRNSNKARDPSLTPKKSRSSTKSPKKEGKVSSPKKTSESIIVSSISPLGPDPKELPKNVTKVLPLIPSTGYSCSNVSTKIKGVEKNSLSSVKTVEDEVHVFSGSVVFTISPPPSSLPLPTFSLRPKLSCNAEASGIDSGATDDLRRLLRLI